MFARVLLRAVCNHDSAPVRFADQNLLAELGPKWAKCDRCGPRQCLNLVQNWVLSPSWFSWPYWTELAQHVLWQAVPQPPLAIRSTVNYQRASGLCNHKVWKSHGSFTSLVTALLRVVSKDHKLFSSRDFRTLPCVGLSSPLFSKIHPMMVWESLPERAQQICDESPRVQNLRMVSPMALSITLSCTSWRHVSLKSA